MADKVRILMEEMLPDMLQFIKRKLFDKEEVQEIMKTREQHEYRLLRKSTSAIEFLQAIQFEYDLERRRKLKFQELKLKRAQTKDYSSNQQCLFYLKVIRRVIQLWDKLTDKFKYNIDLWKQYLSLCYFLKSKKLFFKTITRAVQYNPQILEFWLMAIYYEYETNNNPFKARKIFYKLLKVNSNKIDVWVEYFKFEFKFLEQIYQRESFLGGEIQSLEIQQDITDDQNDKEGEFRADFIQFDTNEKDEENLKILKQNKITSSYQILELLKLIYDLAIEKFKNLKFVVSLLKSINQNKRSENFLKIENEVRDMILNDIQQRIQKQGNNFNLDSLIEFYLEKYQISTENNQKLVQFFSDIFSIVDQKQQQTIQNGLLKYMNENNNIEVQQFFFLNNQFVNYFDKKSIECLKNNLSREKILKIIVKFSNKYVISKNFEQECLLQLSDNQSIFNTNEIILLTQILSQKLSLEILENQLIGNFQHHNRDGIYRYHLRYLELADLSNQNETVKLINWSIQKLLIYKEEFKNFFKNFLLKINQQSYSQKIYELIFNKLLSLNSLCPLDVYTIYIRQQDCYKQNVLKQVNEIFEKIQQWFKHDQAYWELYLTHKFTFDPQDCPQILEVASKISGIKYCDLFALYNRIQDISNSDNKIIFKQD